ncbi:restriction endonuclease subunit S [Ectopseudomonas mendocina]|uniref:restriction endonuclease subunit S n=1 Tax=Ectopseudomonas mendocina TaxID=300 RepID=UPI0005AA6010|nr:restriction endonuclease subunit S [Pseudomonas mendocina]VEE16749.1 type I restriction-modification system subunit S [Pseudomonas mendocina]
MSQYKPYPAYKDSGVEWLGRVPEHWHVARMRYVATLNPPVRRDLLDDPEQEVSFLPMEAIGEDGSLNLEQNRPVADVRSGYSYFENGDVAFAKVTPCFENGKGALMLGLQRAAGFGTTELTVVRPNPAVADARYINYIVQASSFRAFGAGAMTGAGGLKRVPDEFTRNFPVSLPDLDEQRLIASKLDRETARIDALVEKKTRFIELLREKRQALITHTVTKGLDPNVKMKHSGVEWLGEVPEHWDALPLRRVVSAVKTGGTPSEEPPSPDSDGLAWYTPGDFGGSLVLTSSEKRVSALAVSSGEAKTYPAGAVLVVSIGATLGKVGYLVESASANQQINAVIPNSRMSGYFLAYSLSVKTEAMWFLANAATIGIMNQEKTKEIWLAVPPSPEQKAITEYLDQGTGRLDSLIGKTEHSITLLKERRSALITAAVTGQIDLRESV